MQVGTVFIFYLYVYTNMEKSKIKWTLHQHHHEPDTRIHFQRITPEDRVTAKNKWHMCSIKRIYGRYISRLNNSILFRPCARVCVCVCVETYFGYRPMSCHRHAVTAIFLM